MRCPGCGNEVPSASEFCGYCGNPLKSSFDGLAGNQLAFPQVIASQFQIMRDLPRSTTPHIAQIQSQAAAAGSDNGVNGVRAIASFNTISQSDQGISNSHPPPPALSFYADATEAINMPPISHAGYGWHSQPLSGGLPNGHYSQPLSGGLPNSRYSQGIVATPSQQLPTQNTTPLIISICIVVLVIIIISAAIIYQGIQPKASQTKSVQSIGTLAPMPTHTFTPVATPVPDAGFIWCGLECIPSGFMDEYPNSWRMSLLPNASGLQFFNPLQADQLALFKSRNNPTGAADAILASELQNSYGTQPGYQATNPLNSRDVTIGGETWSSASIIYLGSTQQEEQVTAYVTVHQGKAFILEIQSTQAQFAQVSTAYYNIMINKFQFT